MTTTNKPNTGFWIVAVISLLWNLMGVFQFSVSTFMKEMMEGNYSEAELELANALPTWYTVIFGIAVFSGLLGSIVLLLRKKVAIPLFGISLLTVLVVMGYWLFATEVMAVVGVEAAIMPMLVIAFAIFIYFYSKGCKQKGWIG